jgi:hypothetical protein
LKAIEEKIGQGGPAKPKTRPVPRDLSSLQNPFNKGFHKLRTREDLIRFNEDLAKPEFFDMMASNSEIIHHFL